MVNFENKNFSGLSLHTLFNDLSDVKNNTVHFWNKNEYSITNNIIVMGGNLLLSENIIVNINKMILNNGIIDIMTNSTLIINNSFNFSTGMIKGNGVLNIEKNGVSFLTPTETVNSLISEITIQNYGNIYAYDNTINFIKFSILNNYGNIAFHGSQIWENNHTLSGYQDPFPLNWEFAPKGQIYENTAVSVCAEKCSNFQIILSTAGKALKFSEKIYRVNHFYIM